MIDESCSTDRLGVKLLVLALLALGGPVASGQQRRVFMARDGEQAIQPVTGNTSINMLPGETAHIAVFLEDTTPGPTLLNSYQLVLDVGAEARVDGVGSVTYVDNNPGQEGGDSVFIDPLREDWVFADQPVALPVLYNEMLPGFQFGLFYAAGPGLFEDPAGDGIQYLMEFDFVASSDACGEFELRFSPDEQVISAFFNPTGQRIMVDEWQTLTIQLQCDVADDCDDGNLCTVDICSGCCTYLPIECNDGDSCTIDTCDPIIGCEFIALQACSQASDCDDGDACTFDNCSADGCCIFVADCTATSDCNDDNPCTVEACTPDGCCEYSPLTCGDTDPCTIDTCDPDSGCLHTPMDCDDGDRCTTEACNPDTGECQTYLTQSPCTSNKDCDDDDLCTIDTCNVQGCCEHEPLDCDDGVPCTVDSCLAIHGCVNVPVECDDDNACTIQDCNAITGECQIIEVLACEQLRVFMARDGEQASQPASGPTAIDMLPGETATIGVFLEDTTAGPTPLNAYQLVFDFTADALPCGLGTVTYVDNNPGLPGGNSVFLDQQRKDWVFADHLKLPIFYYEDPPTHFGLFNAIIPGTFEDIDGAGIRYLMEFDLLASTNSCGEFELAFRLPPDPTPLSALFNPFGVRLDVDEWQALTIRLPPRCECVESCDDDNACTIEACSQGCCTYTPMDCNDGDPCTEDDCDPGSGCTFTPLLACARTSDCDDEDACTLDLCIPEGCCEHENLVCDDADPCTIDSCDAASGCVAEPITCDDKDPCTDDQCDVTGACTFTPQCKANADCIDNDPCTLQTCTLQGCCEYVPVTCDDGDPCTADTCIQGSGCSYPPVDCEDGNPCTIDTCSPASGCSSAPLQCDDGDACTSEACNPLLGGCETVDRVDCGPPAACSAASCDPATGQCQELSVNTGQPCDDGDDCTVDDRCLGDGACAGTAGPGCAGLPVLSGAGMAVLCLLLAAGVAIRRPA
jgi:hypothetical protein